jgi:hypothetical protein
MGIEPNTLTYATTSNVSSEKKRPLIDDAVFLVKE